MDLHLLAEFPIHPGFCSRLLDSRCEITLENEATSRPVGLLRGKSVHRYSSEAFGKTLGEAEVELADRVGIVRGHLCERTTSQNERHPSAALTPSRTKTIFCQLLLQSLDGIALFDMAASSFEAGSTPDLMWTQAVLQGPTE